MKIIIKSYHATGWLCPILGENFKQLQEYCKDNDEDIEVITEKKATPKKKTVKKQTKKKQTTKKKS